MENKEIKETKEVKKTTRKTITKEEMNEIVDALFDKIKSELDFNEYRLHKGLHKENVDMMKILMERIADLEDQIKGDK